VSRPVGQCPGGCCPHDGAALDAACPADLPQAPLPERAAHLYACQMLSTYQIGAVTGADRQRITRLLHEAGVAVAPGGAGRRPRRTPEDERLDALMARLYKEQRMPSTMIAVLAGIPDRVVLSRLRAQGITIRSRGRNNREDRVTVAPDDLTDLYLRAGLPAGEVGKLLGVSHRIVLRSAHDQGLPVRVGGAPPSRGPADIELLAALYEDPEVRRVLDFHGVPVVPEPGPIWERFPAPHPLTAALVTDLYEGCGLSSQHIELLTGRPAAAVRTLLRASAVPLRPAGGRSPFMRRWREAGRRDLPVSAVAGGGALQPGKAGHRAGSRTPSSGWARLVASPMRGHDGGQSTLGRRPSPWQCVDRSRALRYAGPVIQSPSRNRVYAPTRPIYAQRRVRRRGSPLTAVTANGPCLFYRWQETACSCATVPAR